MEEPMKLNIKSTIIVLLSTLVLVISAGGVAFAGSESSNFDGRDCTDDTVGASTIDYIMAKYQHKKVYDGPGQCWGYAEKVKETLADKVKTTTYNGLRFTKSSFKTRCLNVKAGTHIRFSHGSSLNGGYGHSVVLLKVTDKQVIWADNNYYRNNTVSYYKGTMNDFYREYGQYEYINMIAKPTCYKEYSSPKLAVQAKPSKDEAELSWLSCKNAEGYRVYRSYSKDGDYQMIAETEKTNFVDDTVKKNKTVYYKVRAFWEGGSKISNNESCKL